MDKNRAVWLTLYIGFLSLVFYQTGRLWLLALALPILMFVGEAE